MNSTSPFYDRSLAANTLDSGFDSCTTSGNVSNTGGQPEETFLRNSLETSDDNNIINNFTNENNHEIESPVSTNSGDDNFEETNQQNNRTPSADSGSTFEIIDNSSPPSPTSYQLVEDSPVSGADGVETENISRNFQKLNLIVPLSSSFSNDGSTNQEQIDNRLSYSTNTPAERRRTNQNSTKNFVTNNHDEDRDTFSPIDDHIVGLVSDLHRNIENFARPSTSTNAPRQQYNTSSTLARTTTENNGDVHNLSLPIDSPLNLTLNCNTNTAIAGTSSSGSGNSNNSDLDNKIIEKKKIKSTSTKEEKQRQNEEIVIMETSSVSSETGSWESVFPHPNPTQTSNIIATGNNYIEVKDISSEKFTNFDRESSVESPHQQCIPPQNVTASCPVSACFIDAASLLDESEVSNIMYPPKLPDGGCFGPNPNSNKNPSTSISSSTTIYSTQPIASSAKTNPPVPLINQSTVTFPGVKDSPDDNSCSDTSQSNNIESWKKKLNLDKLETFHKSFELCKAKSNDSGYHAQQSQHFDDRDSSSSSTSSDSPHQQSHDVKQDQSEHYPEENSNNLSDEEKLWKRENSKKIRPRVEVKDQFNKESPSDIHINTKVFSSSFVQDVPGSTVNSDKNVSLPSSFISGVYEVNEQEIAILRKEQERKQGTLVFKNNIQQFSGHVINPKIPFQPGGISIPVTNESNHFNVYGNSSAPSLAWSDIDNNGSHFMTNYDSNTDFGEASSNFNNLRVTTDSGATSVSCILPDTPHNSIVQIGHNTKVIKDSTRQGVEDFDSHYNNQHGIKIPKSRCDDSAPIISGGVSIKDFTPKQCESPPVRRKTEACPIVSGGFISLDFQRDDEDSEQSNISKQLIRDKPKLKQQTWVVDISDCVSNGKRRRSTSSSSSTENTARSVHSSIEHNNSGGQSQRSGLGFYVSLNDMEPPKSIDSDYSSGTTGASENVSRKLSRSLYDSSKRGTGFYVDLSESENSRNATPPPSQVDTTNSTPRSSTGSDPEKKNIFSMFIDLGEKKILSKKGPFSLASRLSSTLLSRKQQDIGKVSGINNSTPSTEKNQYSNENIDSAGETNILSSDESRKPSLASTEKEIIADVEPESLVSVETNKVTRRPTALQKDNQTKRHSWNNPEVSPSSVNRIKIENKEHKRSASLSNDSSDKNIMSILDKIPLISKTSSMSIDSSLSPFDDITYSKTDLSTYSNNSVTSNSAGENELNNKNSNNSDGTGQKLNGQQQHKKYRRDVKINETFDKSSQGSITDGILSKDLSPSSNTTDTDDVTFQQDDQCQVIHDSVNTGGTVIISLMPNNGTNLKDLGRPTIMETIIETKETSSPKKSMGNNDTDRKQTAAHTMESLQATMERQKLMLETVSEQNETTNESGNFVRLSDLDKPVAPAKFELHSPESIMSKSVGNQRHINRLFQDNTINRHNRPHSWSMTRSTGTSIMNITNSVENLRSLSRLFPHLSKEFSNSLPSEMYSEKVSQHNHSATSSGNFGIYQQRSPSDIDFINSGDISTADSSLASSFSRSALDESSISCRQPRRLGEDLLKMFLQEIGTDVIVEVNGRRIKAHKCILRSRCQYFAAMLAGGWVQSAGNVISLQGYSYSSVHFALCHIYSGACHPPDGISLMELASLADLLGLEGLKEVTAHALKSNYCHNFHKPCSGCIDGILQVLPVALNHALDDLYRKCLKWTCRHYLKVWPTRSFSQLPSEIYNRCRQQIVAHLTSETVLQTVLDCDQLIAQIAHFRWAIVIENLLRDILDAAYTYISDHFSSLIASDSFLSLGNDRSCDISRLENLLLRTASSLNPDQGCRSYQRVTRLNAVLAAKVIKMSPQTQNLNNNKNCNNIANHDFGSILDTNDLEEEMEWNEDFIRLVSAILSAVEQCLTRQCSRAMRVASWQRMDLELRKKIQKLACLTEPLDIRRGTGIGGISSKNQFNTKQMIYTSGNRNQDLYQVKLAIQAHSKRALEQDKQLYRASAHTQTHTQDRNTQTNEKSVPAVNHSESNRNSTGGKVSKSSSIRSNTSQQNQVNPQKPKISVSEKQKSSGHRRTYSEDSSVSTTSTTNVILRQHDNSLKCQNSKRPSSLPHNKSSSTANNTRPISLTNRLAEVRPRYLEPRKPRTIPAVIAIKTQTNNNLHIKNRQMSSSDSSRNSSPATSRKMHNAATRKIGTKSTNMSLDSLASPSKRSNQMKSHGQTENEISVDSLAESMRSSLITEKTVSHESLKSGTVSVQKSRQISRSNPGINKAHLTNNSQTKKPLNAIQTSKLAKTTKLIVNGVETSTAVGIQNTSGSSPSSITNKSSRLSSVSSTGFSPRDAFKNRSISVPIGSTQSVPSIRKSFLSAKSREILARKAANLEKVAKLQQPQFNNTKITNIPESTKLYTVSGTNKINIINKSSSSSSIPTRLKTSHITQSNLMLKKKSPTDNKQHSTIAINTIQKSQQSKISRIQKPVVATVKQIEQKQVIENGERYIKKTTKWNNSNSDGKEQRIEIIVVENGDNQINNDIKYESKLERSSTFCKEASDLPGAELEIIE